MPSTEYDSIGHVSLGALAILYFTRKLLLLSLITFFLLSLSLSLSLFRSLCHRFSLLPCSLCFLPLLLSVLLTYASLHCPTGDYFSPLVDGSSSHPLPFP